MKPLNGTTKRFYELISLKIVLGGEWAR